MQSIHPSPSRVSNPQLSIAERAKGQDNLKWLRRALGRKRGTTVLLAGGVDNLSFRLRVAQSHLRDSFTPSHWSHAGLIFGLDADVAATPVYEISLDPPGGFGFPGATNGLQENTLARYADAKRYPNIAAIRVDVDVEKAAEALFRFRQQRAILDAVELMVRWLAYGWGAAGSGNPLLDGYGIPTASMIELVCNAAGYDVTPNTPSRGSSPEALWQATKWWWEFPRGDAPAPSGSFVIGDPMGNQAHAADWESRLKEYRG